MGLHKDLIGDDLHVNKLHATTHAPGGTDPIDLTELQTQLDSVRPFSVPVVTIAGDVPASIDPTGTTNVSTALAAFIAGVSDGSLINFLPTAIYRIDSVLTLGNRHNLIIDGNGCTLRTTGNNSLWADSGGNSDICIRNFVLIGGSSSPGVYVAGNEWQMGVIVASDRFEVSGCTISAVWGDGFYVTGGANGVWIHNNTVTSAGRNGVSIINAKNILVERNVFTTIGWVVCDNEPNLVTESIYNSIFRLNTIETFGWGFWGASSGSAATIDYVSAEDNVVTGSSILVGVGTMGDAIITRVRVLNNTSNVPAAGPILSFYNVAGLTVTDNAQPLSSGELMDISGCTDISLPVNAASNALFVETLTRDAFAPTSSSDSGVANEVRITRDAIYICLPPAVPTAWSIGGGGVNLLTANQSNAETDTSGMGSSNGTLTRNTVSPIAGVADFMVVGNSDADLALSTGAPTAVTAGQYYMAQALVKTTGMASGRKMVIRLRWINSGGASISYAISPLIDCPTTATLIYIGGLAPATVVNASIYAYVVEAVSGEILNVDNLMLEVLPVTEWKKVTLETI